MLAKHWREVIDVRVQVQDVGDAVIWFRRERGALVLNHLDDDLSLGLREDRHSPKQRRDVHRRRLVDVHPRVGTLVEQLRELLRATDRLHRCAKFSRIVKVA